MTNPMTNLLAAAEAALHLLETPGDFTAEETHDVVVDLDCALRKVSEFLAEVKGQVQGMEGLLEEQRKWEEPPAGETCGPNGAAIPPVQLVGCTFNPDGLKKLELFSDVETARMAQEHQEVLEFLKRYPEPLQQEVLDVLVHDFKSLEASGINNSGTVLQVEYLLLQDDVENVIDALKEAAEEPRIG